MSLLSVPCGGNADGLAVQFGRHHLRPYLTEVAVKADPHLRISGEIPNFPERIYMPFTVPFGP